MTGALTGDKHVAARNSIKHRRMNFDAKEVASRTGVEPVSPP
jgi:hypothetical protein